MDGLHAGRGCLLQLSFVAGSRGGISLPMRTVMGQNKRGQRDPLGSTFSVPQRATGSKGVWVRAATKAAPR